MNALLLRAEDFLKHDPGPGHPENPHRLELTHTSLKQCPVSGLRVEAPNPAEPGDLQLIHAADYVAAVAATAGKNRVHLDPDTATCADSYRVACLAAGALLQGVQEVTQGSASGAFALVRPPGHHAEPSTAMGFCLFNNIAVAAAYAQQELGLRRILILDPDVHHGNGTQRAFDASNEILFVSSHRFPFYPGTGWFSETGNGKGLGYSVNLPLPPGGGDADLVYLYQAVVDPIVRQFEPQLILVSAGFDTWHRDPLGGMRVTEAGYSALFRLMQSWSSMYCPGRLVMGLEGGYDPEGVAAGVLTACQTMAQNNTTTLGKLDIRKENVLGELSVNTQDVEDRAKQTLRPYWSSLRVQPKSE